MHLLSAIVAWSLRNRAVVCVATLLFVLFGVYSARKLPVDATPDLTTVQVQVITSAPALAPTEVEQYVTVPVERAMAGVPRSIEVRSTSKYGISVVTVVFEDGTDIYFARQLVSERMREAEKSIPEGYGSPEIGPITSGLGEVFQFVVKNDALSLMQLEELLDWHIGPLLRTVPGVVEVNSFGGEDRQYQVVLDPKRLQAAGLSVTEVVDALERANANAGGGYIEHEREHFVIGTDGLVKSLDDLQGVVVGATSDGTPITLATIADVRFGPRLRRGAASMDGKGEVVVGVAMMLLGENALSVTSAIKSKLAEIQPSLPAGTKIEPFYDRSQLVERTIATVGKNLLEGAALVILVLLLLLGDLRAGLVVASVIPLAMLFALTLMKTFGLSGNLMSLGAVDFGLIVDGAVIIVENAVRRLSLAQAQAGRALTPGERTAVVEDATLEVRSASVFGEVIIAIVYVPILALTATEGKLFRPMAITVLLALLGAFVLSLTLVPVLTSYFVRPRAEHGQQSRLLGWLERRFRLLLAASLRRWAVGVTAAVASFALAVSLFGKIGAEFVPELDEGDVLVEARRLPGVALSESVQTDLRMQRALKHVPEVVHSVSKTGAPELATDPMGMEQSDVYIALKPPEQWRRGLDKQDIGEEIARALERAVPEVAGSISQPIEMRTNELVEGVKSDVAVLIYGRDLDELARLGERAAELVTAVPGTSDVRVEQVAGLKYLRVVPDRSKLARYGLSIDDINQITETMAVGRDVGSVLEGDRRFGIVVKVAHGFQGELGPLLALPLKSISGRIAPLGDVAKLEFVSGPAQVSREKQSRRVTVEFNVRGRDLMSVVNDAQAALSRLKLPNDYHVEWGGQFRHFSEAQQRLGVVVPLALFMILFLLWMAFRSMQAALVIFCNVPFAIVGGVIALWARDIPFSISAGIGFIALFGVAVLNGLVLVAFARQLEEQGTAPADAIREAAVLRLRPVLMTALVASLGFLPMALSTAPGSEVQRPLASVVIGGLVTSTLLTLLVLPVFYRLAARVRRAQ